MLANLSFSKLPIVSNIYNHSKARDLFFALGLTYAAYKVVDFLRDFIPNLIYTEYDLQARYGKGSWALVTGASDGIGREFCLQLAQRGFNVILVARSEEKLTSVSNEIKTAYPSVETKIVVADFAKSYEEGFFESIMSQITGLDISILVNNVGIMKLGAHHHNNLQVMKDSVIVNCLPQVLLTRLVIPNMLQRSGKSAVINLSSFAGAFVRPYAGLYSATKIFNDYLSRAMAVEYPNIDVLSLRPGFVSTKLCGNRPIDLDTASTEEFVKTALRFLGKTSHTPGHWKHRFTAWKFGIMPEWYRMHTLTERSKKTVTSTD